MTRAWRGLRLGLAIAVGLALAGCDGNGGQDPSTGPDTAETDTADESDTPTETESTSEQLEPPEVEKPTPPPAITTDDVNGASVATFYFLRLYDYIRATGDTADWDSLVSPDCEWCADVRSDAVALHEAGGWVQSPGLEFDISTAGVRPPGGDADFYTVLLKVTEPAFEVVYTDGTTEHGEGETFDPVGVGVRWESGRFVVVAVDYESA